MSGVGDATVSSWIEEERSARLSHQGRHGRRWHRRARRRADVGVQDGRVVAVGQHTSAAETIDADGLVVAPGFVDPHTHYDAQLFWDPAPPRRSLHGVTGDRRQLRLHAGPGRQRRRRLPDPHDGQGRGHVHSRRSRGGPLERGVVRRVPRPRSRVTSGSTPGSWSGTARCAGGHGRRRRSAAGRPPSRSRQMRPARRALAAGGLGFSTSQCVHALRRRRRPGPVAVRLARGAARARDGSRPRGTTLECIVDGCLNGFEPTTRST